MTGRYAGEWVREDRPDDRPGRLGHRRQRERVVRCRDCAHCREFPQGTVCTLRGAAGYFATEPEGFCWLGKERP